MRKMLNSRVFRILICLILVCCFLVNSSPIRANATGLEAAVIAGASAINVPAAIAISATLICLGVMADANGVTFNSVVSDVQDFLYDAGQVLADGTVEMIRILDEAGTATYYATADLLETVRSWLFSSGLLSQSVSASSHTFSYLGTSYTLTSNVPCELVCFWRSGSYYYAGYGVFAFISTSAADSLMVTLNGTNYFGAVYGDYRVAELLTIRGQNLGSTSPNTTLRVVEDTNYHNEWESLLTSYFGEPVFSVYTSSDVSLGVVSTVPIDGTSAKTWASDYAAKGLYVLEGGGSSEDPDDGAEGNDNWKWMLPLSLVAAADLIAMSQADQWLAQTPAEFNDFTTSQEFDVSAQPEIDGYQAIQIDPATDPDAGTDTNPDSGSSGDSSGTSGSWTPPDDHTKFQLVDLKNFFPFCIPFDLFHFFELLNADPVAPVLYWEMQDLSGQVYSLTIDLSEWDSVAQLFRRLQLFLFIVGLAAASRKFIKW